MPLAATKVSAARPKLLRCSFCQAEVDEHDELTPAAPASRAASQRGSIGRFCSTHCRDCVLALEALNPSPLAEDDFVKRRALLTDRLLELWRQGRGPDPALVLQAAKRAGAELKPAARPA